MTFVGRFLCPSTFFTGAVDAAAAEVSTGFAEGFAEFGAGADSRPGSFPDTFPETPTNAVFEACFEQALTTSSNPRMAKAANMAIFCWRDQDESIVPEIGFLVAGLTEFFLGEDRKSTRLNSS